jgi:ParB-like chromosome segregation protein Spo0J
MAEKQQAAAPETRWRNRIVGQSEVAPGELDASPWNWRTHPVYQRDALIGALKEIGWIQQIVVNQRTARLIDGHLRLAVALESGEPTVPVLYVDLDEAEEKLALVTLDPLAALASADQERLAGLLHEVQSGDAALQQMLSELAQNHGLYVDAPRSLEALAHQYGDADDNPEAFWKTISLKVPPETWDQYVALMATMPGNDEAARFAALLAQGA